MSRKIGKLYLRTNSLMKDSAHCSQMMKNATTFAVEHFEQFYNGARHDNVFAVAFPDEPEQVIAQKKTPEPRETHNLSAPLLDIPNNADPMIAFIASAIDAQQCQAEEVRIAQRTAEKARKEIFLQVERQIKATRLARRRQLETFEKEMNDRRAHEKRTFEDFAKEQSKILHRTLSAHTQSEKKRLDQFRRNADRLRQSQSREQSQKVSAALMRVRKQLTQHEENLKSVTNSLHRHGEALLQLESRILKRAEALQHKSKIGVGESTAKALTVVGSDLKRSHLRGNAVLGAMISSKSSQYLGTVKKELKHLERGNKRQMALSFRQANAAQTKGMHAAIMHQKQQQAQQLVSLRSALEQRRMLLSGMSAPASKTILSSHSGKHRLLATTTRGATYS